MPHVIPGPLTEPRNERAERAEERVRELEQQVRWIPVEERLPPRGVSVLTWRPHYSGWGLLVCYLSVSGDWYQDSGLPHCEAGDLSASVSHWRPLPEPPEMKP